MYSVFDDINGYSEPKCWPRFNLGNPNPAPVFCPPEDFFTYYDCCSLDYGDCCRYPKWGNIIIVIIIIIGLICGCCCCIFFIFQFSKTKRQDNKPPPTVEHVEKEVECGGTEISLSPEDKYYHRNTRNTYI
uniref:Vesicular, overexpressed in cancer, prosurvival protein 1 n=1 Tax=Strongyloides stercoralis TaxID=6248 RepID=A0A0K0E1G7_STRER